MPKSIEIITANKSSKQNSNEAIKIASLIISLLANNALLSGYSVVLQCILLFGLILISLISSGEARSSYFHHASDFYRHRQINLFLNFSNINIKTSDMLLSKENGADAMQPALFFLKRSSNKQNTELFVFPSSKSQLYFYCPVLKRMCFQTLVAQ